MNRAHDVNPVGFPATSIQAPADQAAITLPVTAPGPRRRWRRSLWGETWRWLLTGIIFITLAAIVVVAGLVGAIYWQARTDQVRPVDAIVVLGTAQHNGRPAPVLQARLDHALGLYRAGYAPTIVVTGGRAPGDQFTEAEAAEMYLLDQGVPSTAIVRENEGRDTWQSIQGVAEVLGLREGQRVLLVSDGFHLLRSKLMARDLGFEPYGSAALDSPIRVGGAGELTHSFREAFAIIAHVVTGR
jgi:uncharacterized SAM-binding protein YcdF (DUF218 family)